MSHFFLYGQIQYSYSLFFSLGSFESSRIVTCFTLTITAWHSLVGSTGNATSNVIKLPESLVRNLVEKERLFGERRPVLVVMVDADISCEVVYYLIAPGGKLPVIVVTRR